jgi:hypothetical protein
VLAPICCGIRANDAICWACASAAPDILVLFALYHFFGSADICFVFGWKFRELGLGTDGCDTDGEDSQGAATAGRSGVEDSDDDVPIFACRASRTPPTTKKPEESGDSHSGASRGASVAIGASLRSTRSACAAVVHLVRVMRSNGRRLDFLGLTGTMLGDGETRSLADALNALPARGPAAKAESPPETIELKQVHLSEPVRDQLTKAGTRARAPGLRFSSGGSTGQHFAFARHRLTYRPSHPSWPAAARPGRGSARPQLGPAEAASLNKYTTRPAPG